MPVSERKLIERIRRQAPVGNAGTALVTGIGDDAAVLQIPPDHELLVTTDFSIENVHFRRDWHSPELVGWRCLTRGLSDIAAMGGLPLATFLSLAVSSDVPQAWVDRFLKGLLRLARKVGLPLAGGDTAETVAGIQADIVVVGSVPKGTAILRSGAKAGDRIFVTGELGGSAAALSRLRDSLRLGSERAGHFRPMARVVAGQWLRGHKIPSAMIDISDGLSTDLQHICEESEVGAEIEGESVPCARMGSGKQKVELDFALHGGDDYELLFTSSNPVPGKIKGIPVTCIGRILRGKGMRIVDPRGKKHVLAPKGWEHFRA